MPRIGSSCIDASDGVEAATRTSKPLLSVVDEIELLLLELSKQLHPNVQATPSVQAWIDAYNSNKSSQPILDWSAVPAAVDSGSTAMGLSTAKSEKKRAKKLLKLDMDKVNARVQRKRQQVQSFLAVLQPLMAAASSSQEQQQQQQLQPLHIVDFGCGSGNLLLPLAALFPSCKFTGVEMKPAALQLLRQRAAAAGLSNVTTFEGMIEQYRAPFDVALALHACGNATDHMLQMAVQQQAAFIVSPCCVGKLKFSMTGGSSFSSKGIVWTPSQPGDKPVAARLKEQQQQGCSKTQAQEQQQQEEQGTQQQQQQQQQQQPDNAAQELHDEQHQQQQQQPALQHPRSSWLRARLPEPERHFRIMARVADIAHAPADQASLGDVLAQRAAVADSCKRFVELDRCAAAAEAGYAVGLFKVLGAQTMAKNDLLVGLPAAAAACAHSSTATEAAADATTAATTAVNGREVGRWCEQCVDQLISRGLLLTAAQASW